MRASIGETVSENAFNSGLAGSGKEVVIETSLLHALPPSTHPSCSAAFSLKSFSRERK